MDRGRDVGSSNTTALKPSRQSRLMSFFGSRAITSEGAGEAEALWTLRLRLSNPHSLCYLNAGVLSMVHCLEVMGSSEHSALVQMRRQAQSANRLLSLSQQLVVRSHFSGWRFSPVQRDCVELITLAVAQRSGFWSQWEQFNSAGAISDTGACPLFIELPGDGEFLLQDLVDRWSRRDAGRYLTTCGPLLLQLGRSVALSTAIIHAELHLTLLSFYLRLAKLALCPDPTLLSQVWSTLESASRLGITRPYCCRDLSGTLQMTPYMRYALP